MAVSGPARVTVRVRFRVRVKLKVRVRARFRASQGYSGQDQECWTHLNRVTVT